MFGFVFNVVNIHHPRFLLNLDLENTERDPISLGVSNFYLKFLNVHKKLHLKHFHLFSVFGKSGFNMDLLITFHLVLLLGFYYLININI